MPLPGVYDFVRSPAYRQEHAFYEAYYGEAVIDCLEETSIAEQQRAWQRASRPEREVVLRHLGNLRGRRILLLGNGMSRMELAFLAQAPDLVVYSDLSFRAVSLIAGSCASIAPVKRIVFAAVDAMNIPFQPESFDVVYAYETVHHLRERERFLRGVFKALVPGGVAVFLDDGYVPAWQVMKRTVLRPIVAYSHQRTGISPEDRRATFAGGFREDELRASIAAIRGDPWFERSSFLTFLVYRGSEKLLPRRINSALHNDRVERSIAAVDRRVSRYGAVQRNQFRLAWGFVKN